MRYVVPTGLPWPISPHEALAVQMNIAIELFGPPPEGAVMSPEMVEMIQREMHNRYRPLWLVKPCLN